MPKGSVFKKFRERLSGLPLEPEPPEFVVFSFPKSGTHFIKAFYKALTDEDVGYDHLHHYQKVSVEKIVARRYRSTRIIAPYRDPRDALVSYVFWVDKLIAGDDPMASRFGHPSWWNWTMERKLIEVIEGGNPTMLRNIESLPQLVNFFTESPQACVVRFEEFMGSGAGGSPVRQLEVMAELGEFIVGRQLDENEIRAAVDRSLGEDRTFNDPKIGRWREYFTPAVTAVVKQSVWGRVLVELGYEHDRRW